MAANIRSVLEYVPDFRGKLMVVHLAHTLLETDELVDALLDAEALHEIGVRLVLVAEGNDVASLQHHAEVCEMHAAVVDVPLSAGQTALSRVDEIIRRHQIALVASGAVGRFDEGSVTLAVLLGASKYICLQTDEIPARAGHPIFAIPESEVDSCPPDTCSHFPELQAAAAVCRRGIARVHLLSGLHRGVLLDELFSEEGVGTMVHADSYRDIRPLHEDDIPELLSLIARCVADAKLIRRTYEDICDNLRCYYVYTLDDTIVGCVALYPYPQDHCAELGCLFIKTNYEGHGYGRALCRFVEQKARASGFKRIFALSQSAVDFFRSRLNYTRLPRTALPASRLQMLEESGRHSEVLAREL